MEEDIRCKVLEERIARFEERIAHIKEIYNREKEAGEIKLRLQHQIYEEHLAKLNHEAEQLKSMQQTYLPRETFDAFKDRTQIDQKKIEAWMNNMNGRLIILGVLLGAIMFVLNYFKQ